MRRSRCVCVSMFAASIATLAVSTSDATTILFDNLDEVSFLSSPWGYAGPDDLALGIAWRVNSSALGKAGDSAAADLLHDAEAFSEFCDFSACGALDGMRRADFTSLYPRPPYDVSGSLTNEISVLGGNGANRRSAALMFGSGYFPVLSSMPRTNEIIVGEGDGVTATSLFFMGAVKHFLQDYTSFDIRRGVVPSITLATVRLPTAAWLLLGGIVGVGVMARRRRGASRVWTGQH